MLGGMIEGVIAVDRRERVRVRQRGGRAAVRFSARRWSKAGGCWKWSAITRSKRPSARHSPRGSRSGWKRRKKAATR